MNQRGSERGDGVHGGSEEDWERWARAEATRVADERGWRQIGRAMLGDEREPATCPLCGGSQWHLNEEHHVATPCSCAAVTDARETWAVVTRRARGMSDFPAPAVLAGRTFATYRAAAGGVEADALAATSTFADAPTGWLVLLGGPGTGKTHLALATVLAVLARGQGAAYVVVPRLLRRLRESFATEGAAASRTARLADLETVEVLALDEVGAEHSTDWAREQLEMLVGWRYENRLPTLLVSNHPVEEWDYRLASRARDAALARVVELDDRDYRRVPVEER